MEIFISSNLKYLRKRANLSQKKIAELCNKKNTAVSNWEKGFREPSTIDLVTICKFFDVSIDDFVKKDLRK
jgi:transcriptional regulator with XRE-family HTH domain